MTTTYNHSFHWFLCWMGGFFLTICLIFGYNIYICGAMFDAAIWTLVMGAFFLFIPPNVLGSLGIAMVVLAFAVDFLSRHRYTRERRKFVVLLLPIICVLAANGYAWLTHADGTCKMGSWT